MAASYDIVVRGAGIVGKACALLMAQAKLRVALVSEHVKPLGHGDVRAYALNAASRTLLQSLRAWPDAAFATPVLQMQVWGDESGFVQFDADQQGCEALSWIVDVPALEESLAQAIRYQASIELIDAAQAAEARADLTVVCEGKQSASRADHAIRFEAKPYPQCAIAARLRVAPGHQQIAKQWFVRSDQGPEILALLPMADDIVALVWSVPRERGPTLLAASNAEFEALLNQVCRSRVDADAGLLSLVSERAMWPLQLGMAERWVEPGFALVGDAAHTVHPLSGQGLNLGLADAAKLAEVVRQREYWRSVGDLKLLRRYERARRAELAPVAGVTDALERLFSHPDPKVQMLRNAGMRGVDQMGLIKAWLTRQAMGV